MKQAHEDLRIFPETLNEFVNSFKELQENVHKNAVDHGWWEEERLDGELIALIHSELSETLEWLRNGDWKSNHIPDFKGTEEEYADVIIRIMERIATIHAPAIIRSGVKIWQKKEI